MNKVKVFILTVVVIIVGIVVLTVTTSQKIAKEDNISSAGLEKIAQSLTSAGVKFYGASWCPHCATQKSRFKKAVKSLPYIECSTGGAGSPQTQICVDAKIESYPTWEFKNGVRVSSELMPIDLAYITNTELDETSKTELTKQKDEFLATMTDIQKDSYLRTIEDLKNKTK
jgi:thiol-disulfide isomerase/thioredoxin